MSKEVIREPLSTAPIRRTVRMIVVIRFEAAESVTEQEAIKFGMDAMDTIRFWLPKENWVPNIPAVKFGNTQVRVFIIKSCFQAVLSFDMDMFYELTASDRKTVSANWISKSVEKVKEKFGKDGYKLKKMKIRFPIRRSR